MLIRFLFFFSFLLFNQAAYTENTQFRINYGLVTHDQPSTSVTGSQTYDSDDQGFLFSVSQNFDSWWGLEAIYYDFGSNSITGGANEVFEYDGGNYVFNSSGGTITRETQGYGVGGRIFSNTLQNEFLNTNFFVRLGFHHWDHPGSTDAVTNAHTFNPHFYNTGYDLYSGAGFELNIIEDLKISLEYDYFSFNDSTFGQIIGKPSTFLSFGLVKEF